jgi:hypothetical protein
MSDELDFKHSVTFKKSALKRSGKRAKKKTYLPSGEPVHKEANIKRMIPDAIVLIARKNAFKTSIAKYAQMCGVSREAMYNAMTGLTYKHLNIIAKPLK